MTNSPFESVIYAGGSGAVVGGAVGAVMAAWADPIKGASGTQMMRSVGRSVVLNSVTFAAIGAGFVAGTKGAEGLRGKKDEWNSVVGGFVAAVPLAIRVGKVPAGVGLCAAFAAVSYGFQKMDSKFSIPREVVDKQREKVRADILASK